MKGICPKCGRWGGKGCICTIVTRWNFFRVICDSLPQVGVKKVPFQPAVYFKYPLPLHPRESNNLERNVMLNYLDLLPNYFLQLQIAQVLLRILVQWCNSMCIFHSQLLLPASRTTTFHLFICTWYQPEQYACLVDTTYKHGTWPNSPMSLLVDLLVIGVIPLGS